MPKGQWIVWQQSGLWAGMARRAMGPQAASVRDCRTQADCDALLERWPASLVGVEVTEGRLGELLDWLAHLERRWPNARAVALVPGETEPSALARSDRLLREHVLRESGVIDVVYRPRQLRTAAELARRHLARAAETDESPAARIVAELPWGE